MQLVMLQKLERKNGEKSKSIEIAKKLLKIGLTKNNIKKIILSNSTDVKEIMVDILLIFIRVINSDLHSMNNVCSAV